MIPIGLFITSGSSVNPLQVLYNDDEGVVYNDAEEVVYNE